jgi:hypothetical protein
VARHHREGTGTDQRGFSYHIEYQPDWFQKVRVSRQLENGRQSTTTLFRNPTPVPQSRPGPQVRTRIRSPEQEIDLEVSVNSDAHHLHRITLWCRVPSLDGIGVEEISFVVEHGNGGGAE